MLRPGQALLEAYKRVLDFNGRSCRSAYWWFALFVFLGGYIADIIDEYVLVPGLEDWAVFFILFCALVVLPDLSLGMRRLHDTGRRGWLYGVWIIVSYGSIFLPEPDFDVRIPESGAVGALDLIGYGMAFTLITVILMFVLMLILIVLLTRDSQKGRNAYGGNPKGIGNPDVFS